MKPVCLQIGGEINCNTSTTIKLPIYLPCSAKDYVATVSQILGSPHGEGTSGIYISQVGPTGCLTLGIVIHPDCYLENPYGEFSYQTVLRHEMNHYCFFTSLNYGKNISHYLWVAEGLAEYFSKRIYKEPTKSPEEIEYIANYCKLNAEFPKGEQAEYWAGESFFKFMEKDKGHDCIENFINNSYQYSTDSTFIVCKLQTEQLHQQWVNSLQAANQPTEELANQ